MLRDRLHTFVALVVLGWAVATPVSAQSTGAAVEWDKFFDNTVLHEIKLSVKAKDWQSLQEHFLESDYYHADFYWREQVVPQVGIRSRGVGSRSATKPGLNVHFDHYVTGQHFLGLKSVALRNNVNIDRDNQDRSYMHETLSMLLFRGLEHPVPVPRVAHTKLFVNGDYVGLYRIVQSLDHEFLQETYGEHGGYLYKYDYPADAKPYYFENRGLKPEQYVPLPFKPETHKTDPRPEVIVEWIQTINRATAASFGTAIAEYLDWANFIRFVAVENFLADTDGVLGNWGVNNMFVYRPENKKQFVFIGWDEGKTFLGGVDHDIFHNIKDVPDAQKNQLMTRMLAVPEFYDLYLDTLLECVQLVGKRAPGSTDGPNWMEREILRQGELIRDAALTDPHKPFTNEEFERAVADASFFARHRGDSVTRQVRDARAQR